MTIPSTSPWDATPESVYDVTGIRASDENVLVAAALIESFAGLVGADLSTWAQPRLGILKRAVEYQTAFVSQNPTLFKPQLYQSIAADGVSETFVRNPDEVAKKIAPLAKRLLSQLGGEAFITTYRRRGATGKISGKGSLGETSTRTDPATGISVTVDLNDQSDLEQDRREDEARDWELIREEYS